MTELLNAQVTLSPSDLTVTVPLADLNSTVAAVVDQQLRQTLELDYRPGDLGDTPEQYQSRFDLVVSQALARPVGVTIAQREAGARYLLISAQLRQVLRQAEELKSASGSSVRQDLATKVTALRSEQAAQLRASGLQPAGIQRPQSVSVAVEASF